MFYVHLNLDYLYFLNSVEKLHYFVNVMYILTTCTSAYVMPLFLTPPAKRWGIGVGSFLHTACLFVDLTPGLCSGYAPPSRLWVDSEASLWCFFAQFTFRICHGDASETSPTSEWREGRQKAPLKWSLVLPIRIVLLIANDSPYGGSHFENPFQPTRVVLLIENGCPLWRLTFSRQNSFRLGRRIKFLPDASEVVPWMELRCSI